MKKVSLLLAVIFAGATAFTASAQYVVTRETEKVVIENQQGDKVVNIEQDEKSGDRVKVQVAGFEILIGQNKPAAGVEKKKLPFRERAKLASPGHIGFMEVGINMMPAVDYSMYTGKTPPFVHEDSFMELDHSRSWQWAFCPFDFSIKLAPQGILSLSAGIQMVWNNYTFRNNVRLYKGAEKVLPEALNESYRKSKLSNFGFRIPVLLELNLPQRIFIAGGIYGGANINSNTKVKKSGDNIKESMSYARTFYYGLTARVGYDSFYLFANYDLTNFFEDNKGPDVRQATIGIGIAF